METTQWCHGVVSVAWRGVFVNSPAQANNTNGSNDTFHKNRIWKYAISWPSWILVQTCRRNAQDGYPFIFVAPPQAFSTQVRCGKACFLFVALNIGTNPLLYSRKHMPSTKTNCNGYVFVFIAPPHTSSRVRPCWCGKGVLSLLSWIQVLTILQQKMHLKHEI